MRRRSNELPFDRRTELRLLLHAELVAAVARRPVPLARRSIDSWLATVGVLVAERGPIVFDSFVIGRPEPELREVAAELLAVRQLEELGAYDDEEERWYEMHGEDGEEWEPPRTPDRVVARLRGRRGFSTLATDVDVWRLVDRTMRLPSDEWMSAFAISRVLERIVDEVVDVARVGEYAIVGAHTRRDRFRSARLAA